MILHTLQINLANCQYPIYIGEDIFNDPNLLAKHIVSQQVMIVTNEAVAKLYLSKLQKVLQNYQCDTVILPDGEKYKDLTHWEKILNQLSEKKHHRDSTLIALGGGVIGDIAGFAASAYQRGIPFIQIPTTLLAMVDSSIGGKTGVNHSCGKNLIGAFHQPQAVIADLNCLKTLPERELKAGMAEIIKAALIKDDVFFHWLEKNALLVLQMKKESLAKAIHRSCEIKKEIVVCDEKEENVRAVLNLGHTFGHAIERQMSYGHWLHGEAVSVGIVLSAKLSVIRGDLSNLQCQQIENLLASLGLPTALPSKLSIEDLLDAMKMDKKVKGGHLPFILLKNIGHAFISHDVTLGDLKQL